MKNKNLNKILLMVFFVAIAFVAVAQTEAPKTEESINVFAVVSDNLEVAFKDAANALKTSEELDSFPLQGYQIHSTLYLTQYPVGLQEQILAKVEEYASKTREFEVKTSGLELTSGNWFFMNLERNQSFQELCDGIVEVLSPIRAKSDFVPEWAKEFPKKLEYIGKYGSPNVYDEFNPHLTFLSRGDSEKIKRFCKNHEKDTFSQSVTGKVVAIGVGVAGMAGQIKEPWKIFPLQKGE